MNHKILKEFGVDIRLRDSENMGPTRSEAKMADEIERLRAMLPDVPLREAECTTLEHWRERALYLESQWGGCSHHLNKVAGERDRLRSELDRLAPMGKCGCCGKPFRIPDLIPEEGDRWECGSCWERENARERALIEETGRE